MFRLLIIFATLVLASPLLAKQSERATVSALVVKFFDAISAKNIVSLREATWQNSCYDVGEKDCQDLQAVPFGRAIDRWVVNDIKINIVGRKAAISLHSTHFIYHPGPETTKERSVCIRSLEAEKRQGIWKLSRMSNVSCRNYNKEGVYQP
jgi:hypothetical protein